MKFTFILLFTLLAVSSFAQVTSESFDKLKWLTGTWDRTNIKPGRTSHERWEKVSAQSLTGVGVMLAGGDTVFVERISIIVRDNSIYYVADVPENKQPVYFKFVEISDSGFVCENPDHDFPKRIVYQAEGANLKAQISGNGKSQDFLFKKR